VDRDGNRHSVALETKSQRKATQAKLRIEELVSASKTGQDIDAETKLCVTKQKPAMRDKLAKYGLIESQAEKTKLTLGHHLDDYFARRPDVKAATKTAWSYTTRNLIEFFGLDKLLAYTRLTAIVKRANLTPWPKIWHNMRASRQTELEDIFPSHVVCKWLGNSVQVARKHYLQTTDAHFEKATAGECAIFVASSASQEAANEKSDAQETAQTSYVSQGVALPDVVLGQVSALIRTPISY